MKKKNALLLIGITFLGYLLWSKVREAKPVSQTERFTNFLRRYEVGSGGVVITNVPGLALAVISQLSLGETPIWNTADLGQIANTIIMHKEYLNPNNWQQDTSLRTFANMIARDWIIEREAQDANTKS